MTESHDQSYYEIALTNRQVMSIFVVLLVCILASFLGGVWLGRDADASVEMAASQEIVAAAESGEPLESLDFFNRPASPETGARGVSEPSSAVDPPTPAEADRPSKAGDSALPQAETRTPVRRSEPVEKATPPLSRAEAVPGELVIQVFSSNDQQQARRVVSQLQERGYPAGLSPVEVAGRTLHRVRIGPYTDRDEAEVVADSVRRTFEFETWITN